MEFEWDERKNQSNIHKHGISFETARLIFDGAVFSVVDDRRAYGEVRSRSIGQIGRAVIVAVIHTDRNGRTRIISARPADRSERKAYEEAISERTQS